MLERLLRGRFGGLPPEVHARLEAATPDQLERWGLQLLGASSLDEVFTDTGPPAS